MTAGWVLYWLGIITGGALTAAIWIIVYMWSYPNWHRRGYQDHREWVNTLKNSAELAAIPEPVIRSKGGSHERPRQASQAQNRRESVRQVPDLPENQQPRAHLPDQVHQGECCAGPPQSGKLADGTDPESGHHPRYRHSGLPGDDDLRIPVSASGQAGTGVGDEHSPYRDDRAHPGTRRPVTRAYSGADNTPPVIYPEPGTLIPFRAQPAPRKAGATDTGEIRIRAEDFIEDMRRRCAVDRAIIERGEPLA